MERKLHLFWPACLLLSLWLGGCSPARPKVTDVSQVSPTSAGSATLQASPQPSDSQVAVISSPTPEPLDPGRLLVVYTRNGDLWRWRAGKAVRLAAGDAYYPKISPDRQIVAYLRQVDQFHQELWAVNLDGSKERRLVGVEDLNTIGGGVGDPNAMAVVPYYQYAWLPGPGLHRLAFTTNQVYNGPGINLLNDLHVVDADGGQVASLFLSGWGGEFSFSPDGSRVALVQPDKVILSKPDGSDYRPVMSYPKVATYSDAPFYVSPHWSPEGDFLRVALPPADPLAGADQPTTLWRIPVSGGEAVQEGVLKTVPVIDQPVSYSPDLKRLAYILENGEGEQVKRELHLAAFDSSHDQTVAADPMLVFAGWSPDSRRFLYSAGEDQGFFLGSLDAAPQPLGGVLAGAAGLQWTGPQRLLYFVQGETTFELRLYDVDLGQGLLLDSFDGSPPTFDWYQ